MSQSSSRPTRTSRPGVKLYERPAHSTFRTSLGHDRVAGQGVNPKRSAGAVRRRCSDDDGAVSDARHGRCARRRTADDLRRLDGRRRPGSSVGPTESSATAEVSRVRTSPRPSRPNVTCTVPRTSTESTCRPFRHVPWALPRSRSTHPEPVCVSSTWCRETFGFWGCTSASGSRPTRTVVPGSNVASPPVHRILSVVMILRHSVHCCLVLRLGRRLRLIPERYLRLPSTPTCRKPAPFSHRRSRWLPDLPPCHRCRFRRRPRSYSRRSGPRHTARTNALPLSLDRSVRRGNGARPPSVPIRRREQDRGHRPD